MFKKWVENKELAKAYRQRYFDVPQDPVHHPEGSAGFHMKLVRRSIPRAINELKALQNGRLKDILSSLNFDLTEEEMEIVVLAAWLHDIGKKTATGIKNGKLHSRGHQDLEYYGPELEELRKSASPQTISLYEKHKDLIHFLIQRHMDLTIGLLPNRVIQAYFENGRVKNDISIKLLLILMWADKLGRYNPEEVLVKSLEKNQDRLIQSATKSVKPEGKKPFAGSPEEFVQKLSWLSKERQLSALKGKYPQLSDMEIRKLLPENVSGGVTMNIEIPVDKEVYLIHDLLAKNDPQVQLYMVGGAVRDFLFHHFNSLPGSSYKHKDVDLATNLSEQEILRRLREKHSLDAGVKVHEKESDTFGVVFCNVNGKDYEIAPFRIDIGSADGRRPDRVEQGTIQDDAMRRDLTINNLYYDFKNHRILDFNSNGQGIEDVKNGVARPVGDPFERFTEDKLRILRLVRFFGRFNGGLAKQILDQRTLLAIEHFKDLRQEGITGERIADEFVKGFSQVQSVPMYLTNYFQLDLMSTVFPGMQVNTDVHQLSNTRNPRVIFAWLLRGNKNIDNKLISLKYNSNFSKSVEFLVDSMNFDHSQSLMMVRNRDRQLLGKNASREGGGMMTPEEIALHNQNLSQKIRGDLAELSVVSGNKDTTKKLHHFSTYQLPDMDAQALMKRGFKGAEIGKEMSRQASDHYRQSLDSFS